MICGKPRKELSCGNKESFKEVRNSKLDIHIFHNDVKIHLSKKTSRKYPQNGHAYIMIVAAVDIRVLVLVLFSVV